MMSVNGQKPNKKQKKRDTPTKSPGPSLAETGELYSQATNLNMANMSGLVSPQGFMQCGVPGNVPGNVQYGFIPGQHIPPQSSHNWVQELCQKFDRLEAKLNKLDSIESSVLLIGQRVNNLEEEFNAKFDNLERSVSFVSEKYDELMEQNKSFSTQLSSLSAKIDTIDNDSMPANDKVNVLFDRVVDLQARSMRENLIFKGHPESDGEDCEVIISNFLTTEMGILEDMPIVRAHRIGRRDSRLSQQPKVQRTGTEHVGQAENVIEGATGGGEQISDHSNGNAGGQSDARQVYHRPIVVKFEKYKDKERIRRLAPDKLKNKGYYVDEQFPREIEDRRRVLYPVRGVARKAGDDCVLSVDRLFINNERYIPGEPVRSSRCEFLRRPHDPAVLRRRPPTGQARNNGSAHNGSGQAPSRMEV